MAMLPLNELKLYNACSGLSKTTLGMRRVAYTTVDLGQLISKISNNFQWISRTSVEIVYEIILVCM